MYLITAIPIVSIPRPGEQIFSYFFNRALKRGSLADVPFANRIVKALVLKSERIAEKKLQVKKASFKLKGIKRVTNPESVMSEGEIRFALWLSEYFFASLGLVLKMLLPSYLLTRDNAVYYQSVKASQINHFSFNYTADSNRLKKYVEITKKNIATEYQTLVLFPEVLMAQKFFGSLPNNIKEQSVFWGRSMTPKREVEARIKILTNETKVVIGTRGAVLLYLPELKTIILEDEKNDAYKSWDRHPKYDARKVTEYLAEQRGLELIWGSDIPSVRALAMITKRTPQKLSEITKTDLPITIVDMRQELKDGNKSPLSRVVQEALGKLGNKQAILLMNRRGEFTITLCRDCGFVLKCDNCSAPLISFGENGKGVFCRYCATHQQRLDLCPNCKGHRFRLLGAGVRKIEQEIKALFPSLSLSLLDSDIAKTPGGQEKIFNNFAADESQVLLGTQAILKPSYLPKVSLAAILSLETAMLLPEYNGEETVFQLVLGLAKTAKDNFIWQTYQPEHRVVNYFLKKDYFAFLEDELILRKKFSWPPASQLVKLTLWHKDRVRGAEEALIIYQKLGRARPDKITLYEPLESRIFKMRGKYSWNILLKIEPGIPIKDRNEFLSLVPSQWEIDVDPIETI